MKSKRATAAASVEDVKPVDVPQDEPAKKRKRTDEDAEPKSNFKKLKKEKKEKKKEKKEREKKAKEEKKPKKDKSKYNNKTRKEKKDMRKDLQDLPEDVESDDNDEGSTEAAEATVKSQPVVDKVESKTNGSVEDKADKKQEKKKKEKKEKKQKEEAKSEESSSSSSKDVTQGVDAIDLDASSAAKPGRNIVFVGNLPYTATAASITAHFVSLKPVAVRCLTKKEDPKACRGIAFVEFSSPAYQRTCLDKFHHSMFEDGIAAPRKINVELTAGGGGKGQGRQDKIMEKNKKLDENRAKRIEKEKTTKEENQGKEGGNKASARMDIHPSRLALLPGLGR